MIELATRLANLGVSEELSPAEIRRIQSINMVAILACVFNTSYTISFAFVDVSLAVLIGSINGISAAAYATAVAMNAHSRTRSATAIMFVAGPLNLGSITLVMGLETGSFLFMLILPIAAILMSPPRDLRWQLGGVTAALALIVVVLGSDPEVPDEIAGTAVETVLRIVNTAATALFIAAIAFHYKRVADTAEADLVVANELSERLLLNILPEEIAQRLKAGEEVIADRAEGVTILFADLVGSTPMSERLSADRMVEVLNEVFTPFDDLADAFGLEKIKTVGDAYMVVGGLPAARPDHVEAVADMALAMLEEVRRHTVEGFGHLDMRLGIHTGPVVAGVIGRRKFSYDLWGDSVNTAARMESHGIPGEIQVTEAVYTELAGSYVFEPRGRVDVKGKGPMDTYLLKGRAS